MTIISSKKRKIVTVMMILFVLGITTTVFAVTKAQYFYKDIKNDDESGYEIQIKVNKFASDELYGKILEVKDIILNQQNNYEPYMSNYPLIYTKRFDSLEEACSYSCIDFEDIVLGKYDKQATVEVTCNEEGGIVSILIMTDYEVDGNNVQLWYYLFSDLSGDLYKENLLDEKEKLINKGIIKTIEEDIITFKLISSEKSDYNISEYTLKNGVEVPIIVSDKNSNGIEVADSYFSVNNVVYSVHVAAKDQSKENAMDTLINVLEFVGNTK